MLFITKLRIDKILSNFATSISQFVAKLVSTKILWLETVFLLRCVFWMGVGFMVIKPFAFDQSSAVAMADDAFKRGSEIAIEHALSMECADSTCQTIKTAALMTSLTSNSIKTTNVAALGEEIAPIPPIRPAQFN